MSETTTPAVEQGDLLVFKKPSGKWTLVRVDYAVTRRWLSLARGKDAAGLDAAVAAAGGGAAKTQKRTTPAKSKKERRPPAKTGRAKRDPAPTSVAETTAAPAV